MSRRAVLLSGSAAVLVGGGTGFAVGALRHVSANAAPPAPEALAAALAAEDDMLAQVGAVLGTAAGSAPATRAALTAIHADHLAHRTAVQAALAGYRPPERTSPTVLPGSPEASPSPSRSGPAVTSAGALAGVEQRAASAAAARAAQLTGRDATLLASIAACEATHATWLSAVAP